MKKLHLLMLAGLMILSQFVTGQITSPSPYCAAGYDDAVGMPVDHHISNVTLGTLNNTSGAVQYPGAHYAYYNTVTAPNLTKGSSYPLSVTHDGGASIHFVAVYIDFNHNNDFSDAGERVLQYTINGPSIPNPATATVAIPMTATTGVTRMRVMVFEDDNYTWTLLSTNATPCTADATGYLDWGETEDYNVNIVGTTTVCDTVTSLAVSAITTTTAHIAWIAVAGSAGYEYVVNTTAAAPTVAGTAVATNSANVTSLLPGTVYYAHVRNSCGGGSFSAWVTVPFTTVAAAPCDTVTSLAVSAITTTTAHIAWTAVTGSAGYEYVVNTTAAAPTVAGTAVATNSANVTSLLPGTVYYAHVRNSCGGGSFSAWVTVPFTTVAAPCGVVTGLTVSAITTTTAHIAWTAVSGSAGYQYVVNTIAASPTTPGSNTALTNANATSLLPGTVYYVHVRNNCGSGSFSDWVNLTFTTAAAATCDTVIGLTISAITTTSAHIAWTAVPGSMGYQYLVNTTATSPVIAGTSTTLTNANATGLAPGAIYYVHVRNNCAAGLFSAWENKKFTTSVGINDIATQNENVISINPNPVNNVLHIEVSGNAGNNLPVEIIDMTGRVLLQNIVINSKCEVDVTALNAGVYLIRYNNGIMKGVVRFVKQ